MIKMIKMIKTVLALMALAAGTEVFAFTDPLDRPAQLSNRAFTSPLFGVATDEKQHIVTVGPRGHILHSDNSGKKFSQSKVPLSSDLIAVHFPTKNKGWAVGHDGVILHTEDGGKTWHVQLDGRSIGELALAYYDRMEIHDESTTRASEYSQTLKKEGPIRPLMDVFFEDENTGWAVGAFNLILHTQDGGKNWAPWMHRTENSEEYSLHAIRKIGGNVFIAGELGLVMRLDATRGRFERIATPYPGSFFGLTGRENLVVLFGLRGNVITSQDAGNNWQTLNTDSNVSINSATVLDDGRILFANARGELLVTNTEATAITAKKSTGRFPIYGVASSQGGLVTIGPNGINIVSNL